jgi:hypothetical protein
MMAAVKLNKLAKMRSGETAASVLAAFLFLLPQLCGY